VKRITLSEWQYLAVGPGADQVTRPEAEALLRVAEAAAPALKLGQGEGVLQDLGFKLRMQQTVGVLVTPAVTLEILPKIDADRATVRRNLIHMIAALQDLPISATQASFLDTQDRDILEILIARFAEALLAALRAGAARAYVAQEEELTALRGRLNVERQFSVLAGRADRLVCRHDDLSPDTPLNRVLKAAAGLVARLTRSRATGRSLAEALLHLEGVGALTGPVPDLVFDRSSSRFRQLYDQACMFLRAEYQTTSGGAARGLAILFRMNVVFEAWVAQDLRRLLMPEGWQVRSQSGRKPALWRGGEGVFRMIPDIVISRGSVCYVLDTKWKRLTSADRDPKRGVAQADVYQMLAYQQAWGADGVALIYPGSSAACGADVLRIGQGQVPFVLAEVPVDHLGQVKSAHLACVAALTDASAPTGPGFGG
jgi:5-methylcytosine-specific restriction enzyme subunit McrC